MATIKEAITKLMSMDSSEIDAFVKGAATSKSTVKREAAQTGDAPTSYNGESNIMKLKKMARVAGMQVNNKTNKADVIAYLEANGGSAKKAAPAEKKTATKTAAEGAKLTKDNYDKSKKYTAEQLATVGSRELYTIAREQFDIPRDQLKTKPDTIEALLAAQDGKKATAKKAEASATSYEGMKAKPLYDLCIERGIEVEKKLKPEDYIAALEAADAAEADTDDEYADLSKLELYKLCIKKGIKTEKKLDRQVYLDLLTSEEDEDEEWDDEDGEDEEDWTL